MKENETGISSLHFFIPIVVVIHVCSLGVDTEGLGGGGTKLCSVNGHSHMDDIRL